MRGCVRSGKNHSEKFIPVINDIVIRELGFQPFPGTLNLHDVPGVETFPKRVIEDPSLGMDNCRGVELYPCSVMGVRGGIVRPLIDDYPRNKAEIIAPVKLRRLFDVTDGDRFSVSPLSELASSDGSKVITNALELFSAVIFDLDHTLLQLAVKWQDVKDEVEDLLGEFLSEPLHQDMDTSLAEVAWEHGLYNEFTETIAKFEYQGAEEATPLPLLDIVDQLNCPIGICTRNSEIATERALERFGVRNAIDAIVARETIRAQKPDPKPLVHCLELLETIPGNAVFIGDDQSDLSTATAAGTSFFYPERLDVT